MKLKDEMYEAIRRLKEHYPKKYCSVDFEIYEMEDGTKKRFCVYVGGPDSADVCRVEGEELEPLVLQALDWKARPKACPYCNRPLEEKDEG